MATDCAVSHLTFPPYSCSLGLGAPPPWKKRSKYLNLIMSSKNLKTHFLWRNREGFHTRIKYDSCRRQFLREKLAVPENLGADGNWGAGHGSRRLWASALLAAELYLPPPRARPGIISPGWSTAATEQRQPRPGHGTALGDELYSALLRVQKPTEPRN